MLTTRRELLIGGLRTAAVFSVLSRASTSGLGASEGGECALVVLQLTGGNDGLNTVVPFRQDAYFRARPTLALAPSRLHRLDDDHGLHPDLGDLAPLFADGRAALVHGVGYPNPSRSHFRSLEIWHTADPAGPPGDVGWMGALADRLARESSAPGALIALHVGDGALPLALRGRDRMAPTVRDESGFRLRDPSPEFSRGRARLLAASGADGGAPLTFLRDAARTTYEAARLMEELGERETRASYPDLPLAKRLRLVARLVAGGFGARLFHLEHGGFDTHARQAPVQAQLLSQLGRSLAAFQTDLEEHGVADRVLVLVFSEFGRRTAENGSKGTDHGAAAPVFLIGPRVRAGLHGTPPDLERLDEGDVPFTTDLRAVYAALQRGALGLAPDGQVPALDVIRG